MPEEEKKKAQKLVSIDILPYAKDWNQVMRGLTPKQAASYMTDLKEGYFVDVMRMFDEMEKRDPDIKADMSVRRNSIAHRKIIVHPAEDSGEAKKQAEWLDQTLKTPALKRLPQLLTDAIPKGFALIQMTFAYDGKYLIPDTIQRVPSWGLLMHDYKTDKITDFPMLADDFGLTGTPIEQNEQIIFHRHFEHDFTFMTSGLMYALILSYVLRNYNLKDWAAFVERFGNPLIIGHYGSGADATEKELIRQATQELINDLAAVFDENTKIEIIETKSGGATPFERLLSCTRDFISKVALGQTLTTNESQYGTKAQAIVHNTVRQDLLEFDAYSYELTLNEQLVRNLINLNFSNPMYPVIQIDTRGDATKEDIQAGWEMGLQLSKKQVRQVLNLKEPEDDDDALEKPANAAPTQLAMSESKKKEWELLMLREKREIIFDDILQGAIDGASDIYTGLEEKILKAVEENGYEYALEHLWDLYAGINNNLGAILSDAAAAAEIIGIDEAKREAKGETIALSEDFSDNPVPPDEGLKYLKRKPVVSSRQYKALSSKWKGRMFSVAGYDNLKVLGKAHDFLTEAYEKGELFEDFRLKTNAYFRSQGLAAPDRFHLRTVFETNMQSAYMAGRIREMMENVEERPYWRILTAGDDKVRPSHRALHGRVFHYQELLNKKLIPPFDFNCRCTIQALTAEQVKELGLKVEEKALAVYDDPETGLPVNIRPREGFGGNPDDFDFGILQGFKETLPALRKDEKYVNWEGRRLKDAAEFSGAAIPNEFPDINDFASKKPEPGKQDIINWAKKIISLAYPKKMIGWPDKFEFNITNKFNENYVFNENSLEHILTNYFSRGEDRLRYFPYLVDTIENPWEVWVAQNKTSGEWGLNFIKIFNGTKGNEGLFCRVDITYEKGAKIITYFIRERNSRINALREGIALIYRDDEVVK